MSVTLMHMHILLIPAECMQWNLNELHGFNFPSANQGLGSLATSAERYIDGSWTRLFHQRETQVGNSERLARFTIERRVNHIFCCTSSPVLCRTYVNAQVPASVNVVESVRGIICGYVYLVSTTLSLTIVLFHIYSKICQILTCMVTNVYIHTHIIVHRIMQYNWEDTLSNSYL